MENIKEILFKIMSSALNASKPDGNFNYIPSKPKGKTIILGAGKASASMAKAFEKIYPHKLEGLVVTRYGHNDKTKIFVCGAARLETILVTKNCVFSKMLLCRKSRDKNLSNEPH